MSLKGTILNEIRNVAASQKMTLAPLTDDLSLQDSGLDSLCFAILVARLEDITGRDPLSEAQGQRFPRTIGEFIALYEEAVPIFAPGFPDNEVQIRILLDPQQADDLAGQLVVEAEKARNSKMQRRMDRERFQ